MISTEHRLSYLKNKKIEVVACLLSIILIIEIYCSYQIIRHNKINDIYEVPKVECKTNLEEILNNFDEKGLNVISIEKEDDKYIIGLSIKGTKEDIIKSFRVLDYYTIIDYEFSANYNNIEGKVRLSYN